MFSSDFASVSISRRDYRTRYKSALRTINMLRFLVTLGIGVYAGIYIAQNYEVPRVDEPAKLYQRVVDFLEENKKKP
ncbi:short transmembrane mitochondrial protein 1 [Monomorium pharaonis]|uniref:short transmembrane mitochondrial protein 1 n=1 Tax=Monomorium pharaonis TaxID=307658 RepID=UPI00063EDC0E|nr:short transmembrane mitochondrial protein 1 [Monomorium pharaonis]